MSNLHPVRLPVLQVIPETADTISIQLGWDGAIHPPYKAGQYLTLIAHINGKEVRRAYSLCSSPDLDEPLTVSVKRVEGGLMSNHLPDTLKAGDTLAVLEPLGHFTLEPQADAYRHIVLIGAGSGITPLFSILKTVLVAEPKSLVSLVYGNRNEESIIFRQALEDWQARYPSRLRVVHCLSSPPDKWYGASGRISPEMLNEVLDQLNPAPAPQDTLYYTCGPAGLMDTVLQVLQSRKVAGSKIFKESFVSSVDAATKAAAIEEEGIVKRLVKVIYDDEAHEYEVNPETTILEAALDLDIDLPYSCQSGLCTACRGKLLSGKVHMDETEGLSQSELDAGYVLTCVGHPLTENVVIEIG